MVFEKASNQLAARIFLDVVNSVVFVVGGRRHEHAALDMRQRCGHHEVVARDVDIQILHQADVREVLFRNESYRNIENIEFVLLDQVQQQVEGALEFRELHAVGRLARRGIRIALFAACVRRWSGGRARRRARSPGRGLERLRPKGRRIVRRLTFGRRFGVLLSLRLHLRHLVHLAHPAHHVAPVAL